MVPACSTRMWAIWEKSTYVYIHTYDVFQVNNVYLLTSLPWNSSITELLNFTRFCFSVLQVKYVSSKLQIFEIILRIDALKFVSSSKVSNSRKNFIFIVSFNCLNLQGHYAQKYLVSFRQNKYILQLVTYFIKRRINFVNKSYNCVNCSLCSCAYYFTWWCRWHALCLFQSKFQL